MGALGVGSHCPSKFVGVDSIWRLVLPQSCLACPISALAADNWVWNFADLANPSFIGKENECGRSESADFLVVDLSFLVGGAHQDVGCVVKEGEIITIPWEAISLLLMEALTEHAPKKVAGDLVELSKAFEHVSEHLTYVSEGTLDSLGSSLELAKSPSKLALVG